MAFFFESPAYDNLVMTCGRIYPRQQLNDVHEPPTCLECIGRRSLLMPFEEAVTLEPICDT